MKPAAKVFVFLLGTPFFSACEKEQSPSAKAGELHILAAASLTESFQELAKSFESQFSGHKIVFQFAGSQILETQILNGARADLFVPAHHQHFDSLDQRLLGNPVLFAKNSLAIAVPYENPGNILAVEDLAKNKIRLVLAGEQVPAGRYAREALRNFGIWEETQRNIVSNESNVKEVLVKILLGEADAGIVYSSDLAGISEKQLRTIPLPPTKIPEIQYFLAALKNSQNPEGTLRWISFLQSPQGKEILQRFGFQTP